MPTYDNPSLRQVAIGDLASRASRRTPEKTAFIAAETGDEVTFEEFNAMANQTAQGLLDAGFESGDRIGIVGENSIEIIATKFGVLKAGLVVIANNADLTPDDQNYQLNEANVKGIFVDDVHYDQVAPFIKENELESVVTFDRGGETPGQEYQAYLDGNSTNDPDIGIEGKDKAVIMYTSGTTSRPKGVIHTHESYLQGVYNVATKCDLKQRDTQTGVLPSFHIFQDVFVSNALAVSASTVIFEEFDINTLIDAIEQHDITYLTMMSSMYRGIDNAVDIESLDIDSVRHCIYGLPMEMSLRRKFSETFDADLQAISGQTEVGISLFFDPEWQFEKEGNYVGQSGPVTDVAIMDDEGNLLPQGESGEIVYRGPSIMVGYLKDEEKTQEAWRDGWHRSEDMGMFDEDSLLLFLDRKNDMIKTGGKNVSSVKVQNAVGEHPDVEECTILGLPHERWDEAITAFVVLSDDSTVPVDELKRFAADQLTDHEVPKAIEEVEELPHTSTGKIRKVELAEEYSDYYQNM